MRGQLNRNFLIFLVAGLCFMLFTSGCAKKPVEVEEAPLATQKIAPAPPAAPAEAPQAAEEKGPGEEVLASPVTEETQPKEKKKEEESYGRRISEARTSAPMLPIYFDFDKYNIRKDMKARMQRNAKFLLDHPDVRIQIQGNCDERGTNEYNLALGERRAKSVKAYLVLLGVNADRMETVSFGEERPLDPGHNEKAWAKNRRDDLVILD